MADETEKALNSNLAPPWETVFRFSPRLEGVIALLDGNRIFTAHLRHGQEGFSLLRFADEPMPVDDPDPFDFPEVFADTLKKVLRCYGFPRREILIALPSSFLSMDILSLPPLDAKNLKAVIQRKVFAAATVEGTDDAWCFEILEEKRSEQESGTRVLLARCPSDRLKRIHSAMERHGIFASVITVPMAGMLNLVRAMHDDAGSSTLLALDVSAGGAVLALFKDKVLQQLRFLKERSSFDRDHFNQILHVEMQRTIVFHKEKYKGKSIDKILILGTQAGWVDRKPNLAAVHLPLPRETPETWSRRSGGESGDPARADGGLLALLAGILLCGRAKDERRPRPVKATINFAPPKRKIRILSAFLSVLLALAFTGATWLTAHLQAENEIRRNYVSILTDETRPLDPLRTQHEELLEIDRYREGLNASYQSIRRDRRNVSNALLAVRNSLPDWTSLASISYSRNQDEQNPAATFDQVLFQIEGDFTAGRNRRLQTIIDVLERTGLFESVAYRTSGTRPDAGGGGGMIETIDLELVLK